MKLQFPRLLLTEMETINAQARRGGGGLEKGSAEPLQTPCQEAAGSESIPKPWLAKEAAHRSPTPCINYLWHLTIKRF